MENTNFKKTTDVVENILIQYPRTRNDDFYLYLKVAIYILGIATVYSVSFGSLLERHKYFGLPSFESVSRARRKLQNEYSWLKADEETQDARKQQEQEIIRAVRS